MDPEEDSRNGEIRPGIRELDHTADLGMRVVAETREQLFERAGLGMFALMRGEGEMGEAPAAEKLPSSCASGPGPVEERRVELHADAIDTLLARWLQELLYQYDVHGLIPAEMEFEALADTRLVARVGLTPAHDPPARELKGVTYHGLEVERAGAGWRGQVIFDI
jgi:SHS2 domain-containing protein